MLGRVHHQELGVRKTYQREQPREETPRSRGKPELDRVHPHQQQAGSQVAGTDHHRPQVPEISPSQDGVFLPREVSDGMEMGMKQHYIS